MRYSTFTTADPVNTATSSSRLNLGRSSAGASYFSGLLSDVRLWNKAISSAAIDSTRRTHKVDSTDGLVSWWRWSDSTGKYAHDETSLNNAVLSANNLWRLYAPNSTFDLFADGRQVTETRPRWPMRSPAGSARSGCGTGSTPPSRSARRCIAI
jgi:hypothetical protein